MFGVFTPTKILLTTFCLFAILCTSNAAELKIATVDLEKVTAEYYKAQEIAKELETQRNGFMKELESMRSNGQKLAKETQDLQELATDPALSATAREDHKKNFAAKLSDLRNFEIKYDTAKAQKETEFQTQAIQAKRRIIEEILSATRQIGDKEGFNLVLNASKLNPVGSDVLFTKNIDDITDKVLVSLNAGKPAATESRAAQPPPTK